MKLDKNYFSTDAITLAKKLLGKILTHHFNGKTLKGVIVETEAYIGSIDKACHAYNGKRTPKTEPLYGNPGISYVYSIYGMYYCFNVICNKKDVAEGVLIRAIEPLVGLDEMSLNRFGKSYHTLTKAQLKILSNGPSKLCIAMGIDKTLNWHDMTTSNILYIEDNPKLKIQEDNIVSTTRIGIDYAEEAKDFPWRFYIKNNTFISKK